MFLSHGGRPTKGNGRKRKGVDEYAAENRVDFTSRSIIRDNQLVRILVCRFCCQSIGARSDRIKEHLASKRHQKLKLEAFREAAEKGRDLSQEYSDDSVQGLLPEPPVTMLKFPGKALAHLLEGGNGGATPEGRREMTPEAEDRKPVMPTPPPLKASYPASPPPMILQGSRSLNSLSTPPPLARSSPIPPAQPQNHHNQSPTSPPQQLLCVRWGNFDSNIVSMFSKLRAAEHFVDATLWCEGKTIKCHKMVLSACSTYFEKLLTENPNPHPIIFLKDMRFWEITALVEFMYKGEVSIHQEKLQSLLRAAESLQIKGLGSPSADLDQGLRDQEELDDDMSMTDNSGSGVNLSGRGERDSLLMNHMNVSGGSVGMDLSRGGHGQEQSSPLSLQTHNNNTIGLPSLNNPAKRRKKETPRRLVDLPRMGGYEEGEEEVVSDDEMQIHEKSESDPSLKYGGGGPSEAEEEEPEGQDELYHDGDHHSQDQMDEGSKSDTELDAEEPDAPDAEEMTDETGALSLRVASAAERDRNRKGSPIKKLLLGNNNNNDANFHSTSAAE